MQTRMLGRLWPVSALTLGGGGVGQLWGPTTRDECVATVRTAVDCGITLLDMAPAYGNGEAESVVGAPADGRDRKTIRSARLTVTPVFDRHSRRIKPGRAKILTTLALHPSEPSVLAAENRIMKAGVHDSYDPKFIVVLAGDHVYKMDYEKMVQQHVEQGADVTVSCLEVPRAEANGFGVIHVGADDVIQSFLEKPPDPPAIPGKPDKSLASMGIYVFETRFLFEELRRDAADPGSSHDFGKDIIPYIVEYGKAVAHRFDRSCVRSRAEIDSYWRDVGTVDAYWAANVDLTDVVPSSTSMIRRGRSGPMAKSRHRRNLFTTRTGGAARRWHRSCRADASSPARR
jgi:hypothetical protein